MPCSKEAVPRYAPGRYIPRTKCTCLPQLRIFCPNWLGDERPRDAEDNQQCMNFAKLSDVQRARCVAHLRVCIPLKVMLEWQDQDKRGISIGCTDVRFHVGVGMAIRNALRQIIGDHELPGGGERLHWDNFYRGALYALVATLPEPGEPTDGA